MDTFGEIQISLKKKVWIVVTLVFYVCTTYLAFVLQISGDKLVAGSESGKIYICSINDGKFMQVLSLQSGVPVTSLILVKEGLCDTNVYIGTFRDNCHVYNFHSYHFLKTITVQDSIQCMDTKWGYIFIGCMNGWLHRYCIEVSRFFDKKFNNIIATDKHLKCFLMH